MDLTQDRTKIMLCTYKTYKFCIKEINEMDGSQINSGKWRFRNPSKKKKVEIQENYKRKYYKILEIDEFENDVIYDIILQCHLIHVTNLT